MTDTNPPNDHLTADDLRKYRAGVLSAAEQHRVERLLLENPLYADALEGLEAAEQAKIDQRRVSNNLRERLQNRIAGEQKMPQSPVWLPAVAASVVLVLGIGLYFYWQEQPALVQLPESPAAPIAKVQEPVPRADKTAVQPPGITARKAVPAKRPPVAPKAVAPRDSLQLPKDFLIANSSEPHFNSNLETAPGLGREEIVVGIDSGTGLTVSGRILNERNQPFAGVVVAAKNSAQKTVTDTAGYFTLHRILANDSLQLSHISYEAQTVPADYFDRHDLQLKPDYKAMSRLLDGINPARPAQSSPASLARPIAAGTASPAPPNDFQTYLAQNRRLPAAAKEKGISGAVRVRFQVNPDGSVSQLTVVKSLGYGCDEEAVRLIRESPRWRPALQNGKPYSQFFEQEIVF